MSTRKVIHGALPALLVLGALAGAARGQDWREAFEGLRREVEQLRAENQDLRSQVDALEEGGAAAELEQEIERLDADLRTLTPAGRISNTALPVSGGGFVDQIIWGGEWRTRADWRINTVDLSDQFDDEGVRLDYRFNLGFGFRWNVGPEPVDPARNRMRVTTWFEIQAAGRGANNTAENINSFAGVSIGDFAARDNDLDIVRLYQGYLQLDNAFCMNGLMIRAGRQELTYGTKLMLGTNEFHTGTVHDALRADLPVEFLGTNASVSAFYAKEAAADGQFQPGLSTGGLIASQFRASGDEDELFGLYLSDASAGPIKADLYWIFFQSQGPSATNKPDNVTSANDPAIDAFGRSVLAGRFHTVGTWIRSDELIDGLFLSLEVAYQFGEDGAEQDLGALVVEALVDWTVGEFVGAEAHLHGGYYFAEGSGSGNSAGASPLFISRHDNQPVHEQRYGAYSRFGNLDLIPATNIHVFHIGAKLDFAEDRWIVGLAWLYAIRNHSRQSLTTTLAGAFFLDDRELGHEIDLYAIHRISTQVELFLNVSLFLPVADFVLQQASAQGAAPTFRNLNTDVAFGTYAQIQVRF